MLPAVLGAKVALLLQVISVLGQVQHVLHVPAQQAPKQHERLVEKLCDHDEVEISCQLLNVLAAQAEVGHVTCLHAQVLGLLVAEVRQVPHGGLVQGGVAQVLRQWVADVAGHDGIDVAAGDVAVVLKGRHKLLQRLPQHGDVDCIERHDAVDEGAVVDAVVPQQVVVLASGRRNQASGGEWLAGLVEVVVARGM